MLVFPWLFYFVHCLLENLDHCFNKPTELWKSGCWVKNLKFIASCKFMEFSWHKLLSLMYEHTGWNVMLQENCLQEAHNMGFCLVAKFCSQKEVAEVVCYCGLVMWLHDGKCHCQLSPSVHWEHHVGWLFPSVGWALLTGICHISW